MMQEKGYKSKKLRFIVIDTRALDKSGDTTIFENTKCKSDLYEFLLLNHNNFEKNGLKIALVKWIKFN